MTRLFIIFLFLFISCTVAWAEEELPCKGDSYDTAEELSDVYYSGLEIQEAVRNRDLKALFDFVDGELWEGPVRILLEGKEFSDIFSEEWRAEILAHKPPCNISGVYIEPGNYHQLYRLAKDLELNSKYDRIPNAIYYYDSKYNDEAKIFIIHGASMEQYLDYSNEPVGWRPITENGIGEILPPDCFVHGHNYRYREHFEAFTPVAERDREKEIHFITNSGLYFGKQISLQDAMLPPYDFDDERWPSPLIKTVRSCREERAISRAPKVIIDDYGILSVDVYGLGFAESLDRLDQIYKIFATIPPSLCQELAPHIKHPCRQAHLIRYFAETGGTHKELYLNIYGEFDLPDGRKIIVPLKNYQHETEATAFLMKHNISNVKIYTE